MIRKDRINETLGTKIVAPSETERFEAPFVAKAGSDRAGAGDERQKRSSSALNIENRRLLSPEQGEKRSQISASDPYYYCFLSDLAKLLKGFH